MFLIFQEELARCEKEDHRMRNIVLEREKQRRFHEKEVKAADERIEKCDDFEGLLSTN